MDSFEHPTSRDKAKWILRDLVDILSNYYTLIELEEDQKKKDKLIEMAADIKSHMNFLQDYLAKVEKKEKENKKEESGKSIDVLRFLSWMDLPLKSKRKRIKNNEWTSCSTNEFIKPWLR